MKEEFKSTLERVLEPEIVEKAMAINECVYENEKLDAFRNALECVCGNELAESIADAHAALFEDRTGIPNGSVRYNGERSTVTGRYTPHKTSADVKVQQDLAPGAVLKEARHYGTSNQVYEPNTVKFYNNDNNGPQQPYFVDNGRPQNSYSRPVEQVRLPGSNPPPPPPQQPVQQPVQYEPQAVRQNVEEEKQHVLTKEEKRAKVAKEADEKRAAEAAKKTETPIQSCPNGTCATGMCTAEKPYVIHVKSPSNEEVAKKLKADLEAKGIKNVYIVKAEFPVNSVRKNVYRVRIGYFATRSEAASYAQKNLNPLGYKPFDKCTKVGWWIDTCQRDNGVSQEQWEATKKRIEAENKNGGACKVDDGSEKTQTNASGASSSTKGTTTGSSQASTTGSSQAATTGSSQASATNEGYKNEIGVITGDKATSIKEDLKDESDNDDASNIDKDIDTVSIDNSMNKRFNTALEHDANEAPIEIEAVGATYDGSSFIDEFKEDYWKLENISSSDNESAKLAKKKANTIRKYAILALNQYKNILHFTEDVINNVLGGNANSNLKEEFYDSTGYTQLDMQQIIYDIEDEMEDVVKFGKEILGNSGANNRTGNWFLDSSEEDFHESIGEINDEIDNVYDVIQDTFDGSEDNVVNEIKKINTSMTETFKEAKVSNVLGYVKHLAKDTYKIRKITDNGDTYVTEESDTHVGENVGIAKKKDESDSLRSLLHGTTRLVYDEATEKQQKKLDNEYFDGNIEYVRNYFKDNFEDVKKSWNDEVSKFKEGMIDLSKKKLTDEGVTSILNKYQKSDNARKILAELFVSADSVLHTDYGKIGNENINKYIEDFDMLVTDIKATYNKKFKETSDVFNAMKQFNKIFSKISSEMDSIKKADEAAAKTKVPAPQEEEEEVKKDKPAAK